MKKVMVKCVVVAIYRFMNTSGFAPEYQRALMLFWFSLGYVLLVGLVNSAGVQRGLDTGKGDLTAPYNGAVFLNIHLFRDMIESRSFTTSGMAEQLNVTS